MQQINMKLEFVDLWKRTNAKKNPEPVYDVIEYGYSGREYHNLNHIENCLDELKCCSQLLENPNQVEIAIWFHDIIYDTKAKDNEEKSGSLAMALLWWGNQLDYSFVKGIEELILATKHIEPPKTMDGKFLVDIDLSILGADQNKYNLYKDNIRKEYFWVPDDVFKEKRANVLKNFIAKPSIYYTDLFKQKYEDKARVNLSNELALYP